MTRTQPAALSLVLHAHLPFVRHPEVSEYLEEDWLFEAITECYVPLLSELEGLRTRGVQFSLTLSVSPTLIAMLDDPLLRERRDRHLARLHALASEETARHAAGTPQGVVARHTALRLATVQAKIGAWQGDLLGPVRDLQNSGHLDVIACPATHGFLPLAFSSGARRAQIRAGIAAHTRAFGRRPRGMWLPECGFEPGLDQTLRDEGIEYSFVDGTTFESAAPVPAAGVFAPIKTPAGLILFGRDRETSATVWDAERGYPGGGAYREFHRDLGFDADYDTIRPYLHDDGVRRSVGIKYHRVTDRRTPLGEKAFYDPAAALAAARTHAQAFVADRRRQGMAMAKSIGRPPIITVCFDAELFGHWWYEGPTFLAEALRLLSGDETVDSVTAARATALAGPLEQVLPGAATWGVDATNRVWLSPENAWIYRFQHFAEVEMAALVRRFSGSGGLIERALRQAGREVLLLQSSDFAFMIATGSNPSYACRRIKEHFQAFFDLRAALISGRVREKLISAREARTPIFQHLDVNAWA